jgi:hypothetical protein
MVNYLMAPHCKNDRSIQTKRHRLGSPQAYKLVQDFAVEGKEQGHVKARLTSLMWKFAFSCNPKTFAPYDRRACAGLRKLGYKFKDHDYVSYMERFLLRKRRLPDGCKIAALARPR